MIYLEISDSAGRKELDLMGTFSISEIIDLISEAVEDEDSEDESESESDLDEDEEATDLE